MPAFQGHPLSDQPPSGPSALRPTALWTVRSGPACIGPVIRYARRMDDIKLDPALMGRLAKALAFICGPEHACTVALKKASESGAPADIKRARTQFLKLKHAERQAALAMLAD